MTDKSEGPTNPYGHEDCDDICGCGDKCKISAWDNGYAAGFKAGLERAHFILQREAAGAVDSEDGENVARLLLGGVWEEIEKIC